MLLPISFLLNVVHFPRKLMKYHPMLETSIALFRPVAGNRCWHFSSGLESFLSFILSCFTSLSRLQHVSITMLQKHYQI